jgi:hypothetical protein
MKIQILYSSYGKKIVSKFVFERGYKSEIQCRLLFITKPEVNFGDCKGFESDVETGLNNKPIFLYG